MTWLPDATVAHLRDVADWPLFTSDRYEILAPLARGGMGTVYRAQDRELDRAVAIKVLSPTASNAESLERMRQETRILARLEHPGVVPIYDVGQLEDGRLFYVMKLVRGRRLDEHVADRSLAERLRLFVRICDPVAFAHALGIVHRDLKPENVMVGEFGEVLVMDWGIAVGHAGTGDQTTGMIAGTRAYMSPEQARGEAVDARSDVFSLGAILDFLAANPPRDGTASRPARALRSIIDKARARDAEARYADVMAMADDVNRYLEGERVSANPETFVDRLVRFARKHRAAITIVVAYLILRVLLAVIDVRLFGP
ncbi:MAG TPA: serine/threonine-protein kinase [Vicinamibacterales bacterium]